MYKYLLYCKWNLLDVALNENCDFLGENQQNLLLLSCFLSPRVPDQVLLF